MILKLINLYDISLFDKFIWLNANQFLPKLEK